MKPVVVETAPEFKHVGHLLALNAQIGQKVAEKMRLLGSLRKFEVPLTRSTLLDQYGKLITSFNLDYATQNKRVGMMMNIADLHETLDNAVKSTVDFRFNESIASLVDDGRVVTVTFTSGDDMFDLVIGVVGVHSNTRKLVFGEGFTGVATLWMAVFADMGASLLVVFNGLRLLSFERTEASHEPGGT